MLDGGLNGGSHGELRSDFAGSGRPWYLLVVLAVALAPSAVYHAGVARAGVEFVGAGYVVEPAGQVVSGSDGPVLGYPDDRVTPVRLTVPIRNTSRFTLIVDYPHDLGYPGALAGVDWPEKSIGLSPGEVGWLTIGYADDCPAATVVTGGAVRTIDRLPLKVSARGVDARKVTVRLPVPVRVPAVSMPSTCWPPPELEPAPDWESAP